MALVEKLVVSPRSSIHSQVVAHRLEHDEEVVRRAWRKADMRIKLMPVVVLLYLASYIDRANIGNAQVLGMQKELQLTSSEYNWALSIFFIGYVVYETPSQIILKRISPKWYIPLLTVIWGVICCLVSTVHGSSGLLAVRFFLDIAESGFLPELIYWTLYSSVSLTGAFGGLLATGINALGGTHGISGWRWIFITEGVITTGFGLLAIIFMSNYTETASWLTEKEKAVIIQANQADRALRATEAFNWKQICTAFTNYRTWLWGMVYFSTYIPVYSVILSLPSVVAGLGYSGTSAILMALVLVTGYTSDGHHDRFKHYLVGITVVMAALIVLMITISNVVKYAMFFFVMFMFVPISVIWSWLSSNTAGSNKRAAATGVVFSTGNIGGAIAGQIYRSEWAPRYLQGHAINLGCYGFALISGVVLYVSYRTDNAARDKVAIEQSQGAGRKDMLEIELGDQGDRFVE
ncbi:MFS general substrate transporter [Choiromyces venosus 120613-1]|uniref:MFS general substrate transporter n=1 Tax=Choiromyces venosus 120613-1 TaxID=1336337 RepID=A0A3N4J871_9PEZI|nr:MFS general substrate transporter [Choiromyces venosus 120613-1]